MVITYVILHYMAQADTIECADSILASTENSAHDTRVVIVDNGSPNGTGQVILEHYNSNNKVVILLSKENIGFAKGNNIGFIYAKHTLKADFIVQLNNDTLIEQNNINEIIVSKYQKHSYAVLGPDIVTLDGCHQNPGTEIKWTWTKLLAFRMKKRMEYLMSQFEIFDKYLLVNEGAYSTTRVETDELGVCLHGACYVFSPLYIQRFEGMYDKTFLYMEEDILKLRADKLGYLMMYTPDIVITHKEDISTNMVAVKSIVKKRNIYRNLLVSSKEYMLLKYQYSRGVKDEKTH